MKEEELNNKEKEKNLRKSFSFLLFLIGIGLFLYIVLIICKKYSLLICNLKNGFIFNFLYIIFYGFLSTFIIDYGYIYLLKSLNYYINDINLKYLITTSFLVFVTLIYSALLKNIVEILFQHKIQINEWFNVLGYPIGRILGVIILYFGLIKNHLIPK